jgi:hypothetical protein
MTAAFDNVVIVEAALDDLAASDREPRHFGLILAIDRIHDMADPVGALRAIRGLLDADGLFVWSEPTGSTNPLENRDDSLARVRAALSPYHCLTVSLAEGGAGLGTLLGEQGARDLARAAGYDAFEILPVDSPVQAFYGLRR